MSGDLETAASCSLLGTYYSLMGLMATLDDEGVRKRVINATATAARAREALASTVGTTTLLRLLLSIVLAFSLWIYVTIRTNPDTPRTLQARTMEVRGLADGMVLMTGLPQVDIAISGPLALVDTPPRPVSAYIDLTNRPVGNGQRIPVQPDLPRGLRLVGINPGEVVVDLEPLEQAEVPVVMEAPTPPPPGVRIDQPILEPRTVMVSGARSTLATISRIVVRPDLGGSAAPVELTQTVRPIPLDKTSREVTGPKLEINPATIKVTLPAPAVTGSKSVPIRAVVVGQPAAGYQLSKFVTTPSVATVEGEATLLQNVTVVETEAIDINTRQQTLVQTVRLKAPTGVTVKEPTVQVEIGITPIQAQTRLTIPTRVRGLGPGLRAQGVPSTVDVVLQGPVPRIQQIDVGALRAEVNLQGLGPGTHQVQPRVEGLDQVDVADMQPTSVTVQISAVPTPLPTATAPPATAVGNGQ